MATRGEAFFAPAGHVAGARLSDDERVVALLAVIEPIACLVTGDKQLQAIGRYQNVAILSPREFLDLLADEEGG